MARLVEDILSAKGSESWTAGWRECGEPRSLPEGLRVEGSNLVPEKIFLLESPLLNVLPAYLYKTGRYFKLGSCPGAMVKWLPAIWSLV